MLKPKKTTEKNVGLFQFIPSTRCAGLEHSSLWYSKGIEKSPSPEIGGLVNIFSGATYTEVLIVVMLGFFPLIISDLKDWNFEASSQVCNSFPLFSKTKLIQLLQYKIVNDNFYLLILILKFQPGYKTSIFSQSSSLSRTIFRYAIWQIRPD